MEVSACGVMLRNSQKSKAEMALLAWRFRLMERHGETHKL